ncbi:MAG TPA: hypothetical protein VFX76_15845, partial [Roseiflexaceae bacterium]|nr:hypothetical protein [Roseiflexaceae bacterium]
MSRKRPISSTVVRLALLLVCALAALPALQPSSIAQAATSTLKLSVVSAANGTTSVGNYKYIINIDNTGTTTQRSPSQGCSPGPASYPASCKWVSVAGRASHSPIYTQGDQSDFANGAGLNLPDGRYLISVLADGYKIDGEHFSVPFSGSGLVTVQMQPYDLPDATVRAFVFEDTAPTNSAPDAPAENGLAGFVGHINDYIDEVTTDVYGNPLCTKYEGEDPVTFQIDPGAFANGAPVPIAGSGGKCVSDSDGMLAIPHLGPNRYALSVVPPNGSNWIQT